MKLEIRVNDESVEITGYVNAVGRESHPLRDREGYFIETVMPGTFARALNLNPNIPALLDHDPTRVIAKDKDLELHEDAVGLHVHAISRDPEVRIKAAEGKLRGWSFGFRPIRETSGERDGLRHRVLHEIELREVSLIDDRKNPAYPATSVYTRDDSDGNEMEIRCFDDECRVQDLRSQDQEPPSLEEWTKRIDDLGIVEE